MLLLLLVSFVWAFSFGLIKGILTGLDPIAVATVRIAVATLVLLPWIRNRGAPAAFRLRLALIGAVQFGAMYVAYLRSFQHLQAHEVALFTIFTPLYLILLDALMERRWQMRHLAAAALAVAGAAVVVWQRRPGESIVIGFVLVQISNLCFAGGQLAYRRIRSRFPSGLTDTHAFGWLMLGALALTALASAPITDWSAFHPTAKQWGVLVYLGAAASAGGFLLWNIGATRVNTGTLAAFNNAKVPLGVACSLLFFGETVAAPRLLVSLLLLVVAVWVAESKHSLRN